MKTYRVFVQDRGRGLYSGYTDVRAHSATEACQKARGAKRGLPRLHAIVWPPDRIGENWLDEHVNRGMCA